MSLEFFLDTDLLTFAFGNAEIFLVFQVTYVTITAAQADLCISVP